jgi:hypothetical protein
MAASGRPASAQETRASFRLFRKDPPPVVHYEPYTTGVVYNYAGANPYAPPGPQKAPLFPRTRSCLNQHGVGCYSDPSLVLSGTFHWTAFFVFSSSQNFFAEPCLPYPPRQRQFGPNGFQGGPANGGCNGR